MATKTVINTNMPSTRGISILIDDQDQTKQQQQQREVKPEQQHSPYYNSNNVQQQQQTLRSTQKAENGKITIYQNTTTTRTQMAPTPTTAITRTVVTKLQPQLSKLVATTTTTQIDVNNGNNYLVNNNTDNNVKVNNDKNNDDVANNENANDDLHSVNTQSGEFVNVEEKTSYSTIKQTITTSTAVPTFPQLLLKVVSERGKTEHERSNTQNSNEEMHEASASEVRVGGVKIGAGKPQVGARVTGVAACQAGQSNSNDNRKTSYSNHTNSLPTPTDEVQHTQTTPSGQIQQHRMMIIQCNGNNEKNEATNDESFNNDDNKRHYQQQVGSSALVAASAKTTSTASNVDHDDANDESCSRRRRMTSVVAANGQNAFERICTNDQNGNKYHEQGGCHETAAMIADCTTDDHRQLESKDVNANTNVNAIVVNNNSINSPIVKKATKTVITTTPIIKEVADCARSAVTVTDEERKRSDHASSAIIKTTENLKLNLNQNSNQNNIVANEIPLHVLKIQIKPQEVHTAHERKQVTVVTLNELQVENIVEQQNKDLKYTIPVHLIETNKSADSAVTVTSESANKLQQQYRLNEKMVQKPTTINTVKTTMSLTSTPSAASMAATTILNTGAVSVTGGHNMNSIGATSTKVNANGNGNGNARSNGDANGNVHKNGNTNDSGHGNGNAGGSAHSNGNTNGSVHNNVSGSTKFNAHSNGNTNGNAHTNGTTNGHTKSNGNANGHANTLATSNTSVTELNVSAATHPSSSYLYYVMSSGQFSPSDTLDSGTGSDLESNGNITPGAPTAQSKLQTTMEKLNAAGVQSSSTTMPKMELLLKSTKTRLNTNNNTKNSQLDSSNNPQKNCHTTTTNGAHPRVRSFTDSEESEASSLSCDSLHSTEFIRQSSASPPPTTPPKSMSGNGGVAATRIKMLGSFLPDSLLRDIRDRKFPTNDFESKYGNDGASGISSNCGSPEVGSDADPDAHGDDDDDDDATSTTITNTLPDAMNEQEYMNVEHAKFLCERNTNNISTINDNNKSHSTSKRLSLPNKTFTLDAENGTFVDTKMNSMPRKYEADKYYNFHVKEHENFHSFDMGGGASFTAADLASLPEYDVRSLQDDAFAGYKDIRCGSATSTIRSSKGTVRGVRNRVRNGIATFLQLQQPNLKNFKEKDAGKVVLYTTSMGIIRDTYAKCANVKQILRTLLVKFEERDVFMSIEYQQEIKERMHSEAIKVPQLFVEGQHIGDADTVERLNESGELRQLLKPYKSITTTFTCQTCGGYRLLPCPSCNGSKKSVHRNHFTAEFVALKCMNCDEVGLVKCHNC